MRTPFLSVGLFFLLLVVVLFDRQPAIADCRSFYPLIRNGGYAVADPDGRIVSSCNEKKSFIPASIIKIPLALAAFAILGEDFRFTTEFYTDSRENLYIRGTGDPFLVSEEVDLILDRLKEKGVRTIRGIYIDTSAYNLQGQVPDRGKSDNPYDAPVVPLGVNFNTVNIRVHGNGEIESAEEQTPTLPLMKELGKSLQPGEYRLNICQDDCVPDSQSVRYAGELFRALQKRKGIPGDGPVAMGKVPADAFPVFVHENTRNLREVVFSFLKYSNNYIANQVFLQCGAARFGPPATWEKGREAVNGVLSEKLGAELAQQILMEEGSGLSRKDRVTAEAMIRLLELFRSYAPLLQKKKNTALKSGTLDRVYNYAGYLADGRSFVILLNQEKNTRDAILTRLKTKMKEGYHGPAK